MDVLGHKVDLRIVRCIYVNRMANLVKMAGIAQ